MSNEATYSREQTLVRAYQVPPSIPGGMEMAEEVVKELNAIGVGCTLHPDPTIFLAVGAQKDVLTGRVAFPGEWIVVDEARAVSVHSDEEFKRLHRKVPVPLQGVNTIHLSLHLTLNEVDPFIKQLEIGEAEGYESPLGKLIVSQLKLGKLAAEMKGEGGSPFRCETLLINPEDYAGTEFVEQRE